MARVFITGSAEGLGRLAAKILISQGHSVVLHARNSERGKQAMEGAPGAENVLTADLAEVEETKKLALEANNMGRFDAVIHNAGVFKVSNSLTFAVNSIAPYILTCLMERPERLIYLSSGLHTGGSGEISLELYRQERYNYSDTKLHVILLAKAISRMWPDNYANAVNPGWVPTKMGGIDAPDDLMQGAETQTWLATSNDKEALVSGKYFFHKKEKQCLAVANDAAIQNKFIDLCKQITGIAFPQS